MAALAVLLAPGRRRRHRVPPCARPRDREPVRHRLSRPPELSLAGRSPGRPGSGRPGARPGAADGASTAAPSVRSPRRTGPLAAQPFRRGGPPGSTRLERDAGLSRPESRARGWPPPRSPPATSSSRPSKRPGAEGLAVAGYGAPTRAATLLDTAGITVGELPFTVDRAPEKQGRCLPGSRVPILAPVALDSGGQTGGHPAVDPAGARSSASSSRSGLAGRGLSSRCPSLAGHRVDPLSASGAAVSRPFRFIAPMPRLSEPVARGATRSAASRISASRPCRCRSTSPTAGRWSRSTVMTAAGRGDRATPRPVAAPDERLPPPGLSPQGGRDARRPRGWPARARRRRRLDGRRLRATGLPFDGTIERIDRSASPSTSSACSSAPIRSRTRGATTGSPVSTACRSPSSDLHPPIMLGGGGPTMLRLAAAAADIVGVHARLPHGNLDRSGGGRPRSGPDRREGRLGPHPRPSRPLASPTRSSSSSRSISRR